MDATKRIWQIDAARGIAVVGMIIYHFLFDLEMLFHIPFRVYQFPVILLARFVATLFILLVGISSALKFNKLKSFETKKIIIEFIKTSMKILVYASIISLVTFLLFPGQTIIFGILHFIGLSLLLISPFLFLSSNMLLIVGLFFIFLSFPIHTITTNNYYLLLFGIIPSTFRSLDYFPLFPWFGFVLFGLVIGRNYYRIDSFFNLSNYSPPSGSRKILEIFGRNSLFIYLLHQPVFLAILLFIKNLT